MSIRLDTVSSRRYLRRMDNAVTTATTLILSFRAGTAELCGAVDQDLNAICVRDSAGGWHYFRGWTAAKFGTACDNWIRSFDAATLRVTYTRPAIAAA